MIALQDLPASPSLVRLQVGASRLLALWRSGRLIDISPLTLDELMTLPIAEIQDRLEAAAPRLELDPARATLLAPAQGQEVWGAGVTYQRSREARIEESSEKDVYARVYRAERPELFFKAAGWRVVAHGADVGFRPDSDWTVPEPELAVLSNSRGEVVAYSCGNDMSSRSIEGQNPLYLPQAKVYDRSCSIGPVAVLASDAGDLGGAWVRMSIERSGSVIFTGSSRLSDMVRKPDELSAVLHSAYPLPAGAWLLTGTSIVPGEDYTTAEGDRVSIAIDGLGRLVNRVVVVPHTGATAPFILHGSSGPIDRSQPRSRSGPSS